MAAQSKASVYVLSLAGIAGSNPAGESPSCDCSVLTGRILYVLSDHSSRGVLTSVVCLGVIVKPRIRGGPDPLVAVSLWGIHIYIYICIQIVKHLIIYSLSDIPKTFGLKE